MDERTADQTLGEGVSEEDTSGGSAPGEVSSVPEDRAPEVVESSGSVVRSAIDSIVVRERVRAPDRGPGPTLRDGQPLWTAFLTPIAVIVGAIIIAGSIWYARDSWIGAGAGSADSAAAPTSAAAASAAPADPSPTPTSTPLASTAFESYAASLGLDVAAFRTCVAGSATTAKVDAEQQAGLTAGVSGTPTFLINNKLLVGAMPWEILDEVIQAELTGSPATLDGYSDTIKELAANDPPYFRILEATPVVEGAALEGGASARVRIVEFSDFQCPYCKRWVTQTYASLKPLLGDDISLSFVNFPLTQIHANAAGAAAASECAAAQGRFWEMHDLLFTNQDAWSALSPG